MKVKVRLLPSCILYVYTTQMVTYNLFISIFKQITVTVLIAVKKCYSSAVIKTRVLELMRVRERTFLAHFSSDKFNYHPSFRRLMTKHLLENN